MVIEKVMESHGITNVLEVKKYRELAAAWHNSNRCCSSFLAFNWTLVYMVEKENIHFYYMAD